MKYKKLKINKLPEPEIIEKHIKLPKAANNKYSLVNATYSSENNTITVYNYSLEDSFSDDPEYDNINRWLAKFDPTPQLTIKHEKHHKHNKEADANKYNFSVIYRYKLKLHDEMSAQLINYTPDIENYDLPKAFRDYYLLFSASFNIIEHYLQYANHFYKNTFTKENYENIISLSDQEVLYNEIIDWYFTYDFGALLNKQNEKWLNKFTQDILYVFAVNETIETPEDSARITKLVTERRKKWLNAQTLTKQRLDKKLDKYKQQTFYKETLQEQKDK